LALPAFSAATGGEGAFVTVAGFCGGGQDRRLASKAFDR
jgi:hypothetical protein